MSKTDDIVKLLPEAISLVFASCDRTFFNGIREIHLRVGAPMLVCVCTGNYFLSSNGKPSPCPTGIIITKELLKETVKRLCCGSVYTYEKTIRQGYIPMDGGYRIGVAGELLHSDCGLCVGDITSINIRIRLETFLTNYYNIFRKSAFTVFWYIRLPAAEKPLF